MKMVEILGFSAPFVFFEGHLEEIGVVKVLLKTDSDLATSCGKVSGMSVFRRLRKCGERKKKKHPQIIMVSRSTLRYSG